MATGKAHKNGFWRSKVDWKKTHGNHVDGRSKGENCHASPLDKFFAKRNRSYKYDGYEAWCKRKKGSK